MIIMDHYPCPKPGQPLPPTRQQLWISSTDRDDIMPKCRVWLDGATAFRVGSGSEAVLVSRRVKGGVAVRRGTGCGTGKGCWRGCLQGGAGRGDGGWGGQRQPGRAGEWTDRGKTV